MTIVETLSNGITVIVDEMPWMHSATVGVWVGSGSLSENTDTNGMAHFLEHMAFKGTKNRTSKDIAGSIESRGGAINAYTSHDRTAYHARVLPDDVMNALGLFADIIQNSNYDDKDIEMESNVILQEMAMYRDDPQSEVFRYSDALVFPDHPLGRAILGTEENVKRFRHNDFVDFVKTNYVPSRMFIGVAGPVDAASIITKAKELFGSMEDNWVDDLIPAVFTGGMEKIEMDTEQTHLVMSFNGVGMTDPRYYARNVAVSAIGGGMSSRLFQEVREQRGLCYTVSAGNTSHNGVGETVIYSGTGNDSIDELVDVVSELLVRSTSDVTQLELDQAKALMKARTLMVLDTTSGRIEKSIDQLRYHGSIQSIKDISDQIDDITIDDVKNELQLLCQSDMGYTVYGNGVGNRTNVELMDILNRG